MAVVLELYLVFISKCGKILWHVWVMSLINNGFWIRWIDLLDPCNGNYTSLSQLQDCHHYNMEIFLLSAYLFPQECVPLPSSGNTCYIAPSLRLFFSNSLMVCHHSFLFEGFAREVFLWLGLSCNDQSSTAPTAPRHSSWVAHCRCASRSRYNHNRPIF
jgi:hypothetical protein